MFRKMPIMLGLLIACCVGLDSFIPLELKQFIYSASLSVKALIIMILPLIIFCLLFKAVVGLSSHATRMIGLILALVCFSNFFSTTLCYWLASWVYALDFSVALPHQESLLQPLWSWSLPMLISNDKAMLMSILSGVLMSKFFPLSAQKVATLFERYVGMIMRGILFLIPVFIIGFIMKLQADGVMTIIIKNYAAIFGVIALVQLTYLFLAYFLICRGRVRPFLRSLHHMIPPALSGFSTMSSAATMPLTIAAVACNTQHKDVARSVVPATVNTHLVGDCLAIPILAFTVMKNFGVPLPHFADYFIFALYFVLAKFSVAAVPGGGILVMLPLLGTYLGFNGEMMSLITALYILFDPVITSANVMGNGAFAMVIDRISFAWRKGVKA